MGLELTDSQLEYQSKEKTLNFTAKGQVLGNYWGGGRGAYPTIKFKANTKEELTKQINKALKDGSMDSGMGYESLIGAVLDITTTTSVEIDGKTFTNEESELETFGSLTDEQVDFLVDCVYGM